jgi:hypothetical protein
LVTPKNIIGDFAFIAELDQPGPLLFHDRQF